MLLDIHTCSAGKRIKIFKSALQPVVLIENIHYVLLSMAFIYHTQTITGQYS